MDPTKPLQVGKVVAGKRKAGEVMGTDTIVGHKREAMAAERAGMASLVAKEGKVGI